MIKKRLGQLKNLSLLEWRLLVTSVILLPLTALGLHFFGLRRTQQYMENIFPVPAKASLMTNQRLQDGQTVARMVSVAANHSIYRANCLKKSLVIYWLLRHYGITADLRIGVKKEDCNLNAHSWVEINGNVLDEEAKHGYCVLL